MPVRIKPKHFLKPCRLNLESIEKIAYLIESKLRYVELEAIDGIWEIYNENRERFVEQISKRSRLDSLSISAGVAIAMANVSQFQRMKELDDLNEKSVTITFDSEKAVVSLTAPPEEEEWFEHFLIDLDKCLLPPSALQKVNYLYTNTQPYLRLLPVFRNIFSNTMDSGTVPYCQIIIKEKPLNPMAENIKANLISNVIWWVLTLIGGGILMLLGLFWAGKLK